MPDQAHDLRRLATHCERPETARRGVRPSLLVVAGGKGGVGTTTVALNLVMAVAQSGKRTLFIDANPRGGDAALLCGIEERYTLADVLAGRRTWDEATHIGPSGIRLIDGQREGLLGGTSAAEMLLKRIEEQDLAADLVVIDAGNLLCGIGLHVCHAADAVLMVTSTDAASVVGTFAAIKTLYAHEEAAPEQRFPLYVLVNQAPTARVAETIHYRLARTCHRLLGVELQSAGHLGIGKPSKLNQKAGTIGLNLQASLVDNVRKVSSFKVLLS